MKVIVKTLDSGNREFELSDEVESAHFITSSLFSCVYFVGHC